VQREGIVIHLVVEQLWDWSTDLDRIANLDGRFVGFGSFASILPCPQNVRFAA
jgi:hypothetical protein